MAKKSPYTIEETIARYKKFIGVARKDLPWLKNRTEVQDCALGYSYMVGYKPEQWNCSGYKSLMVKNKTWTTTGRPNVGDAIIFDWSGAKTDTDHIGLVVAADKAGVTYLSANSGDKHLVTINKVGYRYVTGWGRPIIHAQVAPVAPVAPVTPLPDGGTVALPPVPVAEKPAPVVEKPKPITTTVAAPKPTLKKVYVLAKPGDGYWAIAARVLGVRNVPANYAKIQKLAANLKSLNKGARLTPGAKVRIR